MNVDKFAMVNAFITAEKQKSNGYSAEQCLKMFGLSHSGYYAWRDRQQDKDGRRIAKKKEEDELKELFRKIINKLGFVPGKRTFHTHLWRDYGRRVSIKRCRNIMKAMDLHANRPKKDAYKNRATHNHECTAPANVIKQEFYIGPRKVVLTDITYLYYGIQRVPIYLCAFKDAYTKEILGHAVSKTMDVQLVKRAYNRMIDKHGSSLKKADCIIHSDQGSQYLSTTFKRILSDQEFILSVSGRGNSQDNAPMESFFGRMKCSILDLVALCPNEEIATNLIDGYVSSYNDEQYQYSLAGLTPTEYYLYVTTGVYPLDNYYGVKATDLMPIETLINMRRDAAAERAKKIREGRESKKQECAAPRRSPIATVARDQDKIRREITKWRQTKKRAERQIQHLESIHEKIRVALDFVISATRDIVDQLFIPQNWTLYPEMGYIHDMNDLF